jgi:exodeoxyribonuclease X
MTRMLARVIDMETTGFPPDAGICEFGWTDVNFDSETVDGKEVISNITVGMHQSQLLSPGRTMEHGARGQHHIDPDLLKGKPTPEEFIPSYAEDPDLIVAHNAKFEQAMSEVHSGLFKECVWICTLKVAYRLIPKSPNHQNQTLRYFLNLPCDPSASLPAHRAGPDSYVTAHLFAKLLTSGVPPQVMIEWSKKPALMPRCPIGAKTRNLPWPDVDQGFLMWILRQPTMEEDIKYSAQYELNRRNAST